MCGKCGKEKFRGTCWEIRCFCAADRREERIFASNLTDRGFHEYRKSKLGYRVESELRRPQERSISGLQEWRANFPDPCRVVKAKASGSAPVTLPKQGPESKAHPRKFKLKMIEKPAASVEEGVQSQIDASEEAHAKAEPRSKSLPSSSRKRTESASSSHTMVLRSRSEVVRDRTDTAVSGSWRVASVDHSRHYPEGGDMEVVHCDPSPWSDSESTKMATLVPDPSPETISGEKSEDISDISPAPKARRGKKRKRKSSRSM